MFSPKHRVCFTHNAPSLSDSDSSSAYSIALLLGSSGSLCLGCRLLGGFGCLLLCCLSFPGMRLGGRSVDQRVEGHQRLKPVRVCNLACHLPFTRSCVYIVVFSYGSLVGVNYKQRGGGPKTLVRTYQTQSFASPSTGSKFLAQSWTIFRCLASRENKTKVWFWKWNSTKGFKVEKMMIWTCPNISKKLPIPSTPSCQQLESAGDFELPKTDVEWSWTKSGKPVGMEGYISAG